TYIAKGEPISSKDLLPSENLSGLLNKGERAITLKLEAEMQLDHELNSGDRVDVLVCSSAKSKRYTRTVCQNIRVLLAVPKEMLASNSIRNNESNRVTLAASAADCERLNQAADAGKLRLVLRSPAAQETEVLPGADERDILPHFALKEMAESAVKALMPPPAASAPPAAVLPPLPAPPAAVEGAEIAPPAPLQWVVEIFSGSKRETYAVPKQEN
ncbi:MAG: Flp pilus assembly protein CpaB, partial [Candidatus Obscuribacterales bacterium]|nr:Flp pilus assembly protein CpaB [Candidatus Obscuribacterales bacterium]